MGQQEDVERYWKELGKVILPRANKKSSRDITVKEGMSIEEIIKLMDSKPNDSTKGEVK